MANRIGRITTSGTIDEFCLGDVEPSGIVVGADNNLWFTERATTSIGRITVNGVVVDYPIPATRSSPDTIIAGPDKNLYVGELGGNNIAKVALGL
jgi:virginiamycin B lyase